MPISADPNNTITYVLETDRGRDNPPSFRLRFLTVRQVMAVKQWILDASKEQDDSKANQLLAHAIAAGVVECPNAIVLDELDAHLTPSEMWELAWAVLREPRVAENDRKNSPSPATSQPEETGEAATKPTPS